MRKDRCWLKTVFFRLLVIVILMVGVKSIFASGQGLTNITTAKNSVYYVSPDGDDAFFGTIKLPFRTWQKAIDVAVPGDIIYLRGGLYNTDSSKYRAVIINKSGTPDKTFKLWAYPNEKPILKCSGKNIIGVALAGSYWHFNGIEITGIVQYSDSLPKGFFVRNSSNNIFERINSHHNGGPGLVITGTSTNNMVLNSDFHDNYDPLGAGGNADGVSIAWVPKACVNYVRGCRIWNNSDDGLDLWKNEGVVYIENCWSWHNGYIPGTESAAPNGDGQGFKFGRTDLAMDTQPQRIVKNSRSFFNKVDGFDQNYAQVIMNFESNVSFKNGAFGFYLYPLLHIKHNLTNNIAVDNVEKKEVVINEEAVQQNNSWQRADFKAAFLSLDATEVLIDRNPDGSLPKINFLNTSANKAPSSNAGADQVVDAGVLVTLDGTGSTDSENDILTYHWIAPGGITLSSETDSKPSFIAPVLPEDTRFIFQLVINDGTSNSTADQVEITVKKAPPVIKLLSKANNIPFHATEVNYSLYLKKDNVFSEEIIPFDTVGDTIKCTLVPGEWIVLASPLPESPFFLPTYAGNALDWKNAELIFTNYGKNVFKEISCFVPENKSLGQGLVFGYVYENAFRDLKETTSGETPVIPASPIKDALVRIYKKGSTIPLLSVFTDSSGYYKFENVDFQEYEVCVDLPGYLQTQKYIVALSGDAPKASLFFSVNKTAQMVTGVSPNSTSKIILYPDPTRGIVTLAGLPATKESVIKIYTSDGMLIYNKRVRNSMDVLDITDRKSGTYLFVVNQETFKIVKK